MSVVAMQWVWRHSDARHGARLVLLALADAGWDDGTNCFPGVDRLATGTRMTRRAVQLALRKLEQDDEIVRTGKRPSGTIVYRIPGVSAGGEESTLPLESSEDVDPDRGEESARGGEVCDVNHVAFFARPVIDPLDPSLQTWPPRDTTAAEQHNIEQDIDRVLSHFKMVRVGYGENARVTDGRHRAVGFALRRGYTVAQCVTAITNAHQKWYDKGGRLLCDLPHTLDEDRIDAAIADEWPDDWWELRSDRGLRAVRLAEVLAEWGVESTNHKAAV